MPYQFNPFTAKLDLVNDGDVVGPASSVDGTFPLFSGMTGKLLKLAALKQILVSGFNGISGVDFIQFGAIPATTGAFRLSPEDKIVARDGFDTIDIEMLYLDVYDNVVFAKLLYFNIYTGIASFGFPDSSVPGLKANSDVLEVRVGDDSKYANMRMLYAEVEEGHIMKQTATPSSPPSGYNKLYFKSDGNLYKLNSSGTETLIG